MAGAPAITIIGAGFRGIGMAARLLRAGFDDVTLFEKADRVGGVWAANSYPGAACDIPAALYSYSFAPSADWSRRYRRRRRSAGTWRTRPAASASCR